MAAYSITLPYSDIIGQCKKLSAFEGREKYGTTGESEFEKVLITDQDEALVDDYMHQALGNILQKLGRMIASVEDDATVTTAATEEIWTLRDSGYDSSKYGSALTQHLKEAACAYIMAQWLGNRIPERVDFYNNLYASMLHVSAQNIHSRTVTRPTYYD